MVTEIELFESPDLTPLDFCCLVGWRAKFTKEVDTKDKLLAFTPDEQQTIFARELQSALMLTVGFFENLL
jgi:hypothetical protein